MEYAAAPAAQAINAREKVIVHNTLKRRTPGRQQQHSAIHIEDMVRGVKTTPQNITSKYFQRWKQVLKSAVAVALYGSPSPSAHLCILQQLFLGASRNKHKLGAIQSHSSCGNDRCITNKTQNRVRKTSVFRVTVEQRRLQPRLFNLPGGGRPDTDVKESLEGPLLLVHLVHVVRAPVRLRLDNLHESKHHTHTQQSDARAREKERTGQARADVQTAGGTSTHEKQSKLVTSWKFASE